MDEPINRGMFYGRNRGLGARNIVTCAILVD